MKYSKWVRMTFVLILVLGGLTNRKKHSLQPPGEQPAKPNLCPDPAEGIWKRNVHHHRVIVFVHGLFGDPEGPWSCNPRISWAGLLEEDSAIYEDTGIYLARHESPYFSGRLDIKQSAAALLF